MGYISNKDGSYYEGDLQYGDLEVPNRPSSTHTWDGIQWNAYVPPPPTPQQQRDAIQAQIDMLEVTTKMNRAVREMMLLLAEEKGAALGLTPAQLYLANPAYKAVKDVDNQAVSLRAQKDAIV